jgi:hypothetical protein
MKKRFEYFKVEWIAIEALAAVIVATSAIIAVAILTSTPTA